MNIGEAKKLCSDHGIFQLNKGESLADALDHIQNGAPRKGYKYKTDKGRLLAESEIIATENKEAFRKSFRQPEFVEEEVDDIDDILDSNDFRENKNERGVIIHCYYCGTCIRVDSGPSGEDYDSPEPEIHCGDCMSAAIWNLAM